MKYLVLVFTFFILTTFVVHSQSSTIIETGKQPLSVFQFGTVVHVLTNTIDKNFNGIQDEDDEPSKWYRYNATTRELLDSTIFEWRSYSFPIRIGVDSIGNRLYVPSKNNIAEYNLQTGELVDSLYLEIPARSISTNRGQFGIVDKNSSAQTAYKLTKHNASDFVQQAIRCGENKEYVAVINEGAFGSSTDDSYLTILSDNAQVVYALGKGANHIFEFENKLYITMNGSHEIVVFSLSEMKIEKKISTQTTGFDGPRESTILKDSPTTIYTTTYAGEVKVISLVTDEIITSIEIPAGKVESIVAVKDFIFATIPSKSDYSVDIRYAIIRNNEIYAIPFSKRFNPTQVLAIDTTLFMVFNRVDKNFNSIQDPEDSEAWIFKFDISKPTDSTLLFSKMDSVNLGWSSLGFPTRCSFDPTNLFLYVACNDTIRSYSTRTLELFNDNVTPFKTSYFTQLDSNEFSASIRSENNYVVRYKTIATGKFPQSTAITTLVDGSEVFAVLNEGDFSASATNGSLTLYSEGTTNTYEIGNTANHFFVKNNTAYVTMNGSHEVVAFDLATRQVSKRYPLPTSGFSGPRESALFSNLLYTSAYNGDIFSINLSTDEVKKAFTTSGVPEGIAIVHSENKTSLWTALAYTDATYTADKRVEIFELDNGTSVVELSKSTLNSNELSIVGNTIQYNLEIATNAKISIYTIQGEQVFSQSVASNSGRLALPALSSGVYIVSVQNGTTTSSVLYSLVR
jgi:hypothetical protein